MNRATRTACESCDSDIDIFKIELSSDEGFLYEFKIDIEWIGLKKQVSKIFNTDIHKVVFPIKDRKEILRRLKSKK